MKHNTMKVMLENFVSIIVICFFVFIIYFFLNSIRETNIYYEQKRQEMSQLCDNEKDLKMADVSMKCFKYLQKNP